jgi:hypothetical protein
VEGIVTRTTDNSIEVITDEDPAVAEKVLTSTLRMDMRASEASHKKLMQGLDALAKFREGDVASAVVGCLFGDRTPSLLQRQQRRSAAEEGSSPLRGHGWQRKFGLHLNESQTRAVEAALSTDDVAVIHGPPGTGKTTATVALVAAAVKQGWRVLVAAPSNVAVDNVLERLGDLERMDGGAGGQKVRAVRLGHPARVSEATQRHSLESRVKEHDGTAIVKDVKAEIQSMLKGGRWRREDMRSLRKELRDRETAVVEEVLSGCQVVVATCVGCMTRVLKDRVFDMVVIDEAAQALEASCWIPALMGRRLCLAGDHLQLPPTIKCARAEKGGLGLTMMDRLLSRHGHEDPSCGGSGISVMLEVQYRMNRVICTWASNELYQGRLVPDASVADHVLPDLDGALEDMPEECSARMLLVDSTGCDWGEEETDGGSRRNEGEARAVTAHVKALLASGLVESQIAVISPYNGQVELLKRLLRPSHPTLEIRSVDGFQGGEREAVVLSLVRSNSKGEIGFLADRRRMNVAITRARRHVAVICDSECVSRDPFLGRLMKYIGDNGEYRSALELGDDGNWDGILKEAPALEAPLPTDIEALRRQMAGVSKKLSLPVQKPAEEEDALPVGAEQQTKVAAARQEEEGDDDVKNPGELIVADSTTLGFRALSEDEESDEGSAGAEGTSAERSPGKLEKEETPMQQQSPLLAQLHAERLARKEASAASAAPASSAKVLPLPKSKSSKNGSKGKKGKGKNRKAAAPKGGEAEGDDDLLLDDMDFLEREAAKVQRSQPAYAKVLAMTTQAMKAQNPKWDPHARRPEQSRISSSTRDKLAKDLRGKLEEASSTRQAKQKKKK